ncbi:MAG: hypothetical protein AAB568_01975 [Patescibacteria group bacterium]
MANKVSRNQTVTCWVLKGDIKKFFASIDHKILLDILDEHIPDKDIIGLLENIIESFNNDCHPRPDRGSSGHMSSRAPTKLSG